MTGGGGARLLCYCDHCLNNTCLTEENGLCYARISVKDGIEERRDFSCHRGGGLWGKFACDEADVLPKTKQSLPRTSLTKCCNTSNFCNNEHNFLIELEETKQISLIDANVTSPFAILQQLPFEIKLTISLLSAILIVIILALAVYRCRKRGYSTASTNDGSGSENSFAKLTVDVAISDTNSMASREPLINNGGTIQKQWNNSNTPAELKPQITSLQNPKPLRGPFMAERPSHVKVSSSFQMTIGSGEPLQPKQDTSSGSGAGQPYLTQRSIAHDIELKEVIGRGYFGVVWRGEFKGEPVAVKIFASIAEPSWKREVEIYRTTMLRHKNILGIVAADKKEDDSSTGFWLVTDYYPMGSLYDFLKRETVEMADAVRMAFSVANGLYFLHTEIVGTEAKPAIAHRDLKSKNILVKSDGTCCIADLGMAARHQSSSGVVDVPSNSRVGTRRYLAPELLDNTLNLMDFDAVKATDIYSLGLVLWELLRRTCIAQRPGHDSNPSGSEGRYHSNLPKQKLVRPEKNLSPSELSEPTSASVQLSSTRTQMGSPVACSSEPDMLSQRPTLVSPLLALVPPPPPGSNSDPDRKAQKHQQARTILPSVLDQPQEPIESLPKTKYSYEPSLDDLQESIQSSIDDSEHELVFACDPYEAPYQNFVSLDPSAEEMREVVCTKKIRPPLSARWAKFRAMREFSILMRECWFEKPQSRLPALRLRKSLGDIARNHFNMNIVYD